MIAPSLSRVTMGVILLVTGAASAAPLRVSFTGTTVFVGPPLDVDFPAGSPASGSFFVDPDVDAAADPTLGGYDGPTDVTFTFAGRTLTSPGHPTDPGAYVLVRDQVAADGIEVRTALATGGAIGAYLPYGMQIDLADTDATAFSSDAFPTGVTASDFETRTATMVYRDGGSFVGVTATIATLTIPEPAGAASIAVAALALARGLRRPS